MLAEVPNLRSLPANLALALGEPGAEAYCQLLSLLEDTQGMYALLPIRSNFSPPLRDALLEQLKREMAPTPVRIVRLTETDWNPAIRLVEAAEEMHQRGALVLIGLEETPQMVNVPGEPPKRPPALDTLNLSRETLHRRCVMPIIVWCREWAYHALCEHAPDFFDHFTSLFHFTNTSPEQIKMAPLDLLPGKEPLHFRRGHNLTMRATRALYETLLEENPDPTPKRAHFLHGLAEALWAQQEGNWLERLHHAEELVKEALSLLSKETEAYERARGQHLWGAILSDLAKTGQEEHLVQAKEHFQASLEVYTEESFPFEWARATNNLGVVYRDISTGEREENLKQAIAYFEASLRVRVRSAYPFEWAKTQHNLGVTYALFPENRIENLVLAIAYFESALEIRTEKDYPYEWAKTQHDLGNTYLFLAANQGESSLLQAIACYRAALRVRTEQDFPYEFATTQYSLAKAINALGRQQEALEVWQLAFEGFRKAGVEEFPNHVYLF